jgi:demethylmenaquinone methyltransferase/2-methoxy-6-polyprenyl-1,4-benzoquinol methylase
MPVQSPQSEEQIASMFDRIAPRYDLLNRLLSARQDQRWRLHLVNKIPPKPRGRHLDVATGTGDVIEAMKSAHPEYDVLVGVDISPKMLEIARTKVSTGGTSSGPPESFGLKGPNVEWRLMSAEKLQFKDQNFDSLSIAFGLRNVVNKQGALAEFHRVLRAGGLLLVLEFFPPRSGLLSLLFQFYFHQVLPLLGGLLSDRKAYKYLPESVGSFYRIETFHEVLENSGFNLIETKNYLFGSCRLVIAQKKPL